MRPQNKVYSRYLPPSPEDREWGLVLSDVGFSEIKAGMPYPSLLHPEDYRLSWENGRVLSEYQVVYITKGGGWFESLHGFKTEVRSGDVFLLFPDVWHRYQPTPETGWDEFWVGFNGEHAQRLMSLPFFSPQNPIIHVGQHEPLLKLFIEIAEMVQRESAGYQKIVSAKTIEVLAHLLAIERAGNILKSKEEELIQKSQCLLLQDVQQNMDGQQLAQKLEVGYSWLRKAFKNQTGYSIKQYQLEIQLNKAKELLKNTNLPIHSIAQDLGMNSVFYFSRVFKEKIGVSPTQFRQKYFS